MFVIVGHAASLAAEDADGRAVLDALPSLPAGSRVLLLGADQIGVMASLVLPEGVALIEVDAAQPDSSAVGARRYPGPPTVSGLREGWQAMQLLHCLQRLEREVGPISSIELPALGAPAFWLLQERALRQAFATTTVVVRLTALTSLEAARTGQALSTDDLLRCDMERRCLVDCDRVIADNAAIAMSVARSLGLESSIWASRLRHPRHIQVRTQVLPPVASGVACIASESAALRQFIRAAIGLLIEQTAPRVGTVLLAVTGIDNALAQVPEEWRAHFGMATLDQVLAGDGPAAVVFADRWSASADLARGLARQGRRCIVNAQNPAYTDAAGWCDSVSALRYQDTARDLIDALKRSATWAPTSFPQISPPTAEAFPVLPAAVHPSRAAPLVSVLVPYFNLAAYLPATLANLRASDYPNLDIVVVDDGSTDPTSVQLIDTLQRAPEAGVRVCRLPFNQGLAAARNAGLAAAGGEYILTLDADDLIAPTFISEAVAALERLSTFDFVVPQAAYFDDFPNAGQFEDIAFQHCIALVGEAWQSGLYANRYSTATCLGRRSVMRGLGYNEALRAYEDWDFYQRALASGSRFLVTSDVNLLYRRRPDSMIHAPQMRRRHAQLVAEMGAQATLQGVQTTVGAQTLQVVAAPLAIDGDPLQGLLLSEVRATLDEAARLRSSRIVGTAFRLSAWLHALQNRLWRAGR